MNKRLWVLNPVLLALTLPAAAAQTEEENLIVSANRSQKTVAEMAQTTWVIEGQEIEQQVQGGKEFKDVLAQLIPGIDVSSQGRTNYGMNMRGRAIVVLIDGVRRILHVPTVVSWILSIPLTSPTLRSFQAQPRYMAAAVPAA